MVPVVVAYAFIVLRVVLTGTSGRVAATNAAKAAARGLDGAVKAKRLSQTAEVTEMTIARTAQPGSYKVIRARTQAEAEQIVQGMLRDGGMVRRLHGPEARTVEVYTRDFSTMRWFSGASRQR